MNVKDLPYREVFSLLPAWRREKAERLQFENDKKASAGVWLLLMYAMKKEGLSCGEVTCTERGKPYFTDDKLPRFCLSHSGSYALCAIADEEVGCDVQEIVHPGPKLIGRVCTEREKALFPASPQGKLPSECETDEVPNRDLLFTGIWSKKESLAKLSGVGMAADFDSLETPPDPCLVIDNCAVYVCTKSGGFPQETALVDVNEMLSVLRT